MNNKKLGNDFEAEFCEILFAKGWWTHNFAQNQAGQPADVIAVKNGKTYLIDCKVCSVRDFVLSRIEENQDLAMRLWRETGNGVGWFAFLLGEDIFMLTHPYLKRYGQTNSSLSREHIRTVGLRLDDWVKQCE